MTRFTKIKKSYIKKLEKIRKGKYLTREEFEKDVG